MSTVHEPELVSVVIPTYNRAKLVVRAVDSVLRQTYPNCEIIVVDDGSEDNTRGALAPYKDRIKYIYQANAVQASARNAGIRAAAGKWIAFLDSDDIWLPEKLSRQMEILTSSHAKVSYTNVIWNRGGEGASSNNQAGQQGYNHGGKVFDEPFDLLFLEPSPKVLSTLVVERDTLCRIGCFDERLRHHEDVRVCLRLAFEASFAYIYEPLVLFDRSPVLQRVSVDWNSGFVTACQDAITRAEAYLRSSEKNKEIIKELRRQLGHYISRMALFSCLECDSYDARRLALDGLYFGGRWGTYRRCIAVLICPWLVRQLCKKQQTTVI